MKNKKIFYILGLGLLLIVFLIIILVINKGNNQKTGNDNKIDNNSPLINAILKNKGKKENDYKKFIDGEVLNEDTNFIEYAFISNNKVYIFDPKKLEDGVILDNNIIKICKDKLRRHIINTDDIIIRGNHNYENICAAIAATKNLVPIEKAVQTIKEFTGVEHRIELVRTIDNVRWYNDSASSSPTRTLSALNAFDEDFNVKYLVFNSYMIEEFENVLKENTLPKETGFLYKETIYKVKEK